jgi:hypothetical protein
MIARRLPLLLVALVAIGCSQPSASSSSSASPRTPSGHGGVRLSGSIETSGDFRVTGSFTADAAMVVGPIPTPAPDTATCTKYARGLGNPGTFVSPAIHTTGNPSVFVQVVINPGYTGPGTYMQSSLGFSGTASVSIQQGQGPVYQVYNTRHGGTATLTVAADGSGTLVFTKWGSDEVRQGHIAGFLWGTIQWTCRSA